MTSGGSGAWRSRGRREAMPKPVSRACPSGAVHQNIGGLDVLVNEAALVRAGPAPRRCRRQGAGSVRPPSARRRAARAARRPDPRAAALFDRLRAPVRAAAPPMRRRARPSVHIRARGERGARGTGAPGRQHGQNAAALPPLPPPPEEHASPSSQKTWRPLTPSTSNLNDGFNRWTPHRDG